MIRQYLQSKQQIKNVDLLTMTNDDRLELIQQLYRLNQQIFNGVSFENFYDRMYNPALDVCRIVIYHSAEGNQVGYYAIQSHNQMIENKKAHVARMLVGLLPEYRNTNSKLHFTGMIMLLKVIATHIHRDFYIQAVLIHPSVYVALSRFAEVWPNHKSPTPKRIEKIMLDLLKGKDYSFIETKAGAPVLVETEWTLREETPIDENKIQKSDLQFFLQSNPNFNQGDGLPILIQLRKSDIVLGVSKILKFKLWDKNPVIRDKLKL